MERQEAEAIQPRETEKQTKADSLSQVVQTVGQDAQNRPEGYLKDSIAPAGGE